MMASTKAQEFLEDTLRDVEADFDDLVIAEDQADEGEANEGGTNKGRTNEGKAEIEETLEFGHSLTIEADLKQYHPKREWFEVGESEVSQR
jgi:hypothetical protein